MPQLALPEFIIEAVFKTQSARILIDTGSIRTFLSKKFCALHRNIKPKNLPFTKVYHESSTGSFSTEQHVQGKVQTTFGEFGPITFEVASIAAGLDGIIGRDTLARITTMLPAYIQSRTSVGAITLREVQEVGVEWEEDVEWESGGDNYSWDWDAPMVGATEEEGLDKLEDAEHV